MKITSAFALLQALFSSINAVKFYSYSECARVPCPYKNYKDRGIHSACVVKKGNKIALFNNRNKGGVSVYYYFCI
eukprot:Pgem_evm1s9287